VTVASEQVPFGHLEVRSAEAFARFAARGIPYSHDEEWRFTPVRHLATTRFHSPAPSPQLTEDDITPFVHDPRAARVVIVDGRVDPVLSRFSHGAGVRVAALPDGDDAISCAGDSATQEATPFAALNAALWTGGASIHLGEAARPAAAIEVLHVATAASAGAVITPRTVIYVVSDAPACVIESFVALTDAAYFTNAACEIVLDDGARLEHVRIQRESPAATHIGLTTVHQAARSHYRSFTLALGGRLSRHDLQARHAGEGVETLLYGLYLGRGDQLLDNHTAIFHDQPNCKSWEVYKGVLGERSRGVFNGKVIVQPAAQKTDAKQTNRNLLLSDEAKIHTKPQLEIFADDVKCTHGATVGKLNEQQRFYLQSRGIGGRTAELMLINAFAAEVVAEITPPGLRDTLEALVRAELDGLIA